MQPRDPALPELEHVGDDAIAAPAVRTLRRALPDRALDLGHALLELGAAGDRPRLGRRDRPDLAAARTRREVRIAARGIELLDRALDADLTVQRLPEQDQRGEGM